MKLSIEESLNYHSEGRKGKIEVVATKPCITARDLSMAYTPGVAEPCRAIEKNIEDVYKYSYSSSKSVNMKCPNCSISIEHNITDLDIPPALSWMEITQYCSS